jgi:hypothetical protein
MPKKRTRRAEKSSASTGNISQESEAVSERQTTKKVPSISSSVRRIVVRRPQLTSADVFQTLTKEGWDLSEIQKRKSTIMTLRADALAVISLAKEEGYWKE